MQKIHNEIAALFAKRVPLIYPGIRDVYVIPPADLLAAHIADLLDHSGIKIN